VASEETEVELYADKNKYVFMYRDQNAGWIHSIKTDNRSFENLEVLKYLGTTLTLQNPIHEETECSSNSGNACYHYVQNLLPSSVLSKKLKFIIYRYIILPVVLYWYKIWSLTLREVV